MEEQRLETIDTDLLINEIEKHPAIWDMKSPDYKDRNLKKKCWEETADIFCSSGEVKEEQAMEFGRLKIDIMGLSEVRWEGTGIISDKDITFIYSGGETHQRGVGVVMTANATKSIAGYWAISDRIILVKLKGKQIDVNLIQVCAPTCDYTDEDIKDFYETLTAAKKLCKQHETNVEIYENRSRS
ncbi:craniofacial development protein 2-like [Penaeus japonicus]|uniref:craniofacial development protein 2-like n=1 Tax=Penaeus japonicus TaxID=27405 RepID=UPI001C7129AA|nr:craniofacial development protein 2-like [Penaeus japonicus]